VSEHEANQLTIWAVAIAFPLVGIGKLYLSQIMRRNTFIRTSIGDWLVKMFIAIGLAFICVGVSYGLSITLGWINIPLWARWVIRVSGVVAALMSLVATANVVRALLPLLRSPLVIDRHYSSEQHT
jgi:hypothetical protein